MGADAAILAFARSWELVGAAEFHGVWLADLVATLRDVEG